MMFGNAAVARASAAAGFKVEFENQYIPSEIKGSAQVAAPSLRRGKVAPPVTFSFEVKVEPVETITLYAVPEEELFETQEAALLPPGEDRRRQSLLIRGAVQVPPAPAAAPRTSTAPPPAPTPISAAAVTRYYSAQGPIDIVARSGGFGITGEFHKLAVGAASTTVVKTQGGYILIDAGTAGGASGPLADATVAKLKAIIKTKVIADVLMTHVHLDHRALLPRLAALFEIQSLHINVAQLLEPALEFDTLKGELAQKQRVHVEAELRKQVESERAEWDKKHDFPESAAREAQWKKFVEAEVATRLAARKALTIELQVPGIGGGMRVVSAPIETIDLSKVEIAPGKTVGVLQTPTQSAIVNKNLPDAATRQKDAKEKGEKKGGVDLDRYSTTYVLIVDSKILALVLPDLRVNDIQSIGDRLKAEMTRLGHSAELRVWDIGHHMQAGFTGAHADGELTLAQARASQLLKLTELLEGLTSVKNAAGRTPVDVVSSSVAAALVDPATAWIFRSMGFEILTATGGKDVRLVEAITAADRRVAGLASGEPYVAGSPKDPLLRRAQAAIAELEATADRQEGQARKLRKKADLAEKERLVEGARLAREQATTIRQKAKAYVEQVNAELSHAPSDAKPSVAPAVGAPEPAKAQAEALRAELTGFDRPVVGKLPRFSDVAMAVLGGEIPAEARADLRVIEEAHQLQAEVVAAKENATPELRARYLAALEKKRSTVARRLAQANRAGDEASEERKVLRDEMKALNTEVEVALRNTSANATSETIKRRLPNGKLVETRFEVPKRPSAFTRGVRTGADLFGRGMGAVMVYQLVSGQADLEARYEQGDVGGLEMGISTVHNVYGVSIGVRMVGAIRVAPGEFWLLAAVDIAQTAARDFDTSAQYNAALAYSVIRNALALGLMTGGQALIETGHPAGILIGLGIMFLADPILQALGVYDWLERKFEFLPDEVIGVTQKLRGLLEEYRVVVGALSIAKRDAAQLQAVGGTDPAAVRKAAEAVVKERRQDVKRSESRVLLAFLIGYQEAKKSYGGLPELDQYRAEFLKLMIEAQGEEAPVQKSEGELAATTITVVKEAILWDDLSSSTTREKADAVFHMVEEGMSLAKLSASDVSALAQWSKMDDWMDRITIELADEDNDDIDWKWIAEKSGELDQMFNSARYRIDPASAGEDRLTPLLPKDAPGRASYERELAAREARFAKVRATIASAASGTKQPEGPEYEDALMRRVPFIDMPPRRVEPALTLATAIGAAEAAVAAYEKQIGVQPALGDGLTAESVASHSWEAGTTYPRFVKTHGDYARGLHRLKALELGMRTSIGQAQAHARDAGEVPAELETRLTAAIAAARKAIELRREEKGFLFLDEAQAKVGEIRQKENLDVAAILGQSKDVQPLTADEQKAARAGALEELHLTTITNRLANVAQLWVPNEEEIRAGKKDVQGIYKVVGTYDETDLFIVSVGGTTVRESDNVLVGFVRDAGETTSGKYGHTSRVEVTPLNAAAIRLFGGTGNQTFLRNLLWPATIDDLKNLR